MKVEQLINEIQQSHQQKSSSIKDEILVMQSMLNDTSYEVDVYSRAGKVGTYNPAKDFRKMQNNIIASVLNISKKETEYLTNNYEVTTSDAATMVNISKEFVNTYLETGRKLPFGGREKSQYAITLKEIPETEKVYQIKTDNGYEKSKKVIPEHKGLSAQSSCPVWLYE